MSGNRTSSGRPLLANDPHLQLMAPSIWVLNRLKSASFDAVGASFVGTPGVILGHNANISWGVTNVGTDCQDLFIMDGNRTHYRWKVSGCPPWGESDATGPEAKVGLRFCV